MLASPKIRKCTLKPQAVLLDVHEVDKMQSYDDIGVDAGVGNEELFPWQVFVHMATVEKDVTVNGSLVREYAAALTVEG